LEERGTAIVPSAAASSSKSSTSFHSFRSTDRAQPSRETAQMELTRVGGHPRSEKWA
jgi:hypothetical protein